MLSGLPVLATEVIPIKRIIDETQCGVVCQDLDPADIAAKLEYLRTPEIRESLGTNGYRAVLRKYNWESEKARLEKVMSSLAVDPNTI